MINNNSNLFQRGRGFTLIEMLIVVAIISILASVILVGLGPARTASRDARRIADLREVQNALEIFFNRCTHYPTSATPAPSTDGQACPAAAKGIVNLQWSDLQSVLINSNIRIDSVPNDPTIGNDYFYGTDGGSSYVLGAVLEDPNNQALQSSPHSIIYGVDCSSPVYCVRL
ncbi:MAG: type II secretion system protein [Patescibacteria group bacterium]|nr:type II secretion system GspH family protein [Patescibacteria group bacterium]MDE2015027.1 type II secretion system protein [Patescibacteria group bacterium]MDE2226455.1 type II secretion system protein [Patescibacteria group bacterium]